MSGESTPRLRGVEARHTTRRILRDLLAASIRHGEFTTDSLAEFRLVTRFGASRGAVREALLTLAGDGLLRRRKRLGTHVTDNTVRLRWDEPPLGRTPSRFTSEVLVDRDVLSTSLLRRLLRSEDHDLRMRDIRLAIEGVPIGFRTAYLRATASHGSAGIGPVSAVYAELGTARADAQAARLLRVDAGVPMLTRMQVFADVEGDRLAVTFDQFRGDRVSLSWD